MNKIIMNFLIVEGNQKIRVIIRIQGCSYEFYERDRNREYLLLNKIVDEQEIASMTDRLEIKRLILNGKIDEAIQFLNVSKPDVKLIH